VEIWSFVQILVCSAPKLVWRPGSIWTRSAALSASQIPDLCVISDVVVTGILNPLLLNIMLL